MTDITATARTISVPAGVRVCTVQLFAATWERYAELVAEHDATEETFLSVDGELYRWARWTTDGVPYVLYQPARSDAAEREAS